jgi:hypothetical protein
VHVTARPILRRLLRDRSGLALIEFAYTLPIVLGISCYSIELANLALTNLRVSQIALNLADNASRVGLASTLNTFQLREVDINDVFAATKIQGERMAIGTNGRIILSSLENSGGVQRIHWQRCMGRWAGNGWDSSYGNTSTTAGTDQSLLNQGTLAPLGMGDAGAMVTAPPNSGVMFVEVNYQYQPVISARWLPGGSARVHYTASFIVRDNRDFRQVYNPGDAERMTCNKYTTQPPA